MPANETHLQIIQATIARMGQNSFMLKGWAITLISAVFALAAKDSNPKIALVAYVPARRLWMLDAHYLWQERVFRRLFDFVRLTPPPPGEAANFSMDPGPAIQSAPANMRRGLSYWRSLLSSTEVGLYIPLLIAITLAAWSFGGLAMGK